MRPARTALLFLLWIPQVSLWAQSDEDELFQSMFGSAQTATAVGPDQRITVGRILVVTTPEMDEGWIRTLVSFREGQSLTYAKAIALAAADAWRMRESGQFSSATVDLVRPGAETIVRVEVTNGFWYTFMFRPWDLQVDFTHLFHADKSLRVSAGLNTQGIEYSDPGVLHSPLFFDASALHSTRRSGPVLLETTKAGISVGWRFSRVVDAGISGSFAAYAFPSSYFLYPDYAAPDASVSIAYGGGTPRSLVEPGVFCGLGLRTDGPFGLSINAHAARVFWLDSTATGMYRMGLDTRLSLSPFSFLCFVSRAFFARNSEATFPFLSYSPSDAIRGPADRASYQSLFALRNTAALENTLVLSLGILSIDVRPYAFMDLSADTTTLGLGNRGPSVTFGGGLRVAISRPVGIYVDVGIGADPSGQVKPLFTVTAEDF